MNTQSTNAPSPSLSEPRELGRLLTIYWRRWAAVTLLATLAAVAYAKLSPKVWQASQALIVRNAAVGGASDADKFRGPDDLKSLQETILELSKSHQVLKAALVETGPPSDYAHPDAWPAEKDVEGLQSAVKVAPPKGVEFGASEVFYLEVRDKDKNRAAALSSAISHQLQLDLQEIRNAKAQSMVDELSKALQVAQTDLQSATSNLTVLEKKVGSDLPELRALLDANSSDTSLRRTASEIENELRQIEAAEKSNRQLLVLLKQSQADPAVLIAAPNRLLESQPALRRLKDGLVDAQLRTATLQGRMSAVHPQVIEAKEAEAQVAERLHAELDTAIRGLDSELTFDAKRLEMLQSQRNTAAARLAGLAGLRATYTNLLSEVTSRAKLLDKAEQTLTAARSDCASAKAASLIACVDAPSTGTRPVSPSGTLVVLGGALGGLLTGIGLVLLTAPTAPAVARTKVVAPANRQGSQLTPYVAPASSAMAAAAVDRQRISTVSVHGSLTCTQALKVLSEQGKFVGKFDRAASSSL